MFSSVMKSKICGLFFLLVLCPTAWSIAVMSVDFGTEWMKIGIVSPGVPMEIALNRESQRKTPVIVSFRDQERSFGDPATTIAVRFPEKAYMYLLNIIGKQIDNPLVEHYKKTFPFYDIEASENRKTLVFKHPEGMTFSVEELVAMLFKQAQDIAQRTAGQPIKDVVITVPAFFTQAERRAMIHAAQLSGLNVLQLLNSNTAVALNYGVFRRKDFNETATNIMFYDMGAGSTIATIVTYQLMKLKETGEINPQLTVKGVGFDHTLGGLEMQLRLRDFLAKKFAESKKTSTDVFKNNRAMAKLFKEAGRVKKVLSANSEHVAQVESLLDDIDFKHPLTRTDFEELCQDLFLRVTGPVEEALKSAQMDLSQIDQVILAGSGTRVPKVQQLLLEYVKKDELGKSLNTDESAALGAAYQAAHLSKGFKVKTFLIKDANLFPIQVDFQRAYEMEDKSTGIKSVKRTLFGRNNGIPLKKIMTFNRHIKDFEFFVNYGELGFLNDFELQALGSLNISKVSLKGVEGAITKQMDDKTEYKGVKAHFRVDESGILNLDEAEAVFEKPEEESPESKLESAFTKLGNTIGRLFSSSSEETDKEGEKETKKESKTEEPPKVSDDKTNETKPESVNQTKAAEKKNETEVNKETKFLMVKEPLVSSITYLDLSQSEDDDTKSSMKKLKELDALDKARLEKAKAKNSLESFIVETKHKLYSDEFEKALTEEEKAKILSVLTETSDWLEYESDNAATEVFKKKVSELAKLTRDFFERVREHRERPEAIKSLTEMLNISSVFLKSAKNMSEDDQLFTEVELKTLEDSITDTTKWLKENKKEQDALPLTSSPKMTLKLIAEKIADLDREVKYLLNKARFAQPLKKKVEKEKAKEEKANETAKATEDQTAENKTVEVEKETKEEAPQIDIPELSGPAEQAETTSPETSTPEPTPEIPSPDKVKEKEHSEL